MASKSELPPLLRDYDSLPDFNQSFVNDQDIEAFSRAIHAPDATDEDHFITAQHDWHPINQRIPRAQRRLRRGSGSGGSGRIRIGRRGKDETREGIGYAVLKWPMLVVVFAWLLVLSVLYVMTRFYISQYEYWVTWRGRRNKLRLRLRAARTYEEWRRAAEELDLYLGAQSWKEQDEFDYYDHKTVRKIVKDLKKIRVRAEAEAEGMNGHGDENENAGRATEELKGLIEMCVKNNFAGVESPRLYSQTYYGTKHLVQSFVDEVVQSLKFLCETDALPLEEKRVMFSHLASNYGKTALCLSGGASFSYYHFGVVKAHLSANLLPNIITGTSGGALVAALVCTRTDQELHRLLVPELHAKISACHDSTATWVRRWWRTGARFDSIDWASRCCWFTRGSMTFKEAYLRTGRILNISCVPSDPHSPSLLLNYLTAPDCCIFSAVLASAAVPGILNPVVLMTKTRSGTIAPYSFGNKWKDGSLRTDIPIRSLNLHFNVNFSIVSQVNPHVNIFFFASRGSVGRPVTHRRGKGWRGGFLGSALEQYLKLDLAKWLKVLRHLELLPRPMSQDWSSVFLQKFDGTITVWPRTALSDFYYILSDPTYKRLERMLTVGEGCTWSKIKFVENRLRIERMVERGRASTRSRASELEEVFSSEDLQRILTERKRRRRTPPASPVAQQPQQQQQQQQQQLGETRRPSLTSWLPWSSGNGVEVVEVVDVVEAVEGGEEGLRKRGNRDSGFVDGGVDIDGRQKGWTSDSLEDEDDEDGDSESGGVGEFEARGETVLAV